MVYGKKTGARAQYTLDIDHTDRFAPSTMRRGTIIAANGKCWLERIVNARYGLGAVANWHQEVKEMGGEEQVRNRRKSGRGGNIHANSRSSSVCCGLFR